MNKNKEIRGMTNRLKFLLGLLEGTFIGVHFVFLCVFIHILLLTGFKYHFIAMLIYLLGTHLFFAVEGYILKRYYIVSIKNVSDIVLVFTIIMNHSITYMFLFLSMGSTIVLFLSKRPLLLHP